MTKTRAVGSALVDVGSIYLRFEAAGGGQEFRHDPVTAEEPMNYRT
jgi:hypothetical protein